MASGRGGEPAAKRARIDDEREVEAPLHLLDSNPKRPLYFLTRARGIHPRFNDNGRSVSLAEILSPLLGDLQSSVQFNYLVEMDWLLKQYPTVFRKRPLLVVHGERDRDARLQLQAAARACGNDKVELMTARIEIPYGTHHTKMMMLLYNEGMRVVIHTANLIERDWDCKTQAVWISPLFTKTVRQASSAASALKLSEFASDLLAYLNAYGAAGTKCLDPWKRAIAEHDMSTAKVKIVASVPGRHTAAMRYKWGHPRLRELLSSGCTLPSGWPVVGQFSSIGSLGASPQSWMSGEWLSSLAASNKPGGSSGGASLGSALPGNTPLKLVFPNVDTVRNSLEGYSAGGSLPYSAANAAKQPWLRNYLHTWTSDAQGRTRASPHIKTYARMSLNGKRLGWLLLTSANLSKAAWGCFEKKNQQLFIRSYEMGVLFLPQSFGAQSFAVASGAGPPDNADKGSACIDASAAAYNDISVHLPYDVPLTPYRAGDQPWTWDSKHLAEDSHGRTWEPR